MNDEVVVNVGILVGIATGLWILAAFFVSVNNAVNQMNWCQYEKGKVDGTSTGKRWSPNPLTIGLTGECINPGDRGL